MNIGRWIERLTAIVFDERLLLIAVAVALAGFLRGFIGFGAADRDDNEHTIGLTTAARRRSS